MAVPWIGLIDTLIDLTHLALTRKSRKAVEEPESVGLQGRAAGQLETKLTGVVMAALKEAFDRDAHRLDLEREQLEHERQRAERLLKLDLFRQAGDREIGRLRLMAGVAVGSWIGTLLLSTRVIGGPVAARVMLGIGWLLLLAALSLSFAAQSRVSRALARIDDAIVRHDDLTGGITGAFVPWLIVLGLALVGFSMLVF
jgi:hypothetical protein